MTEVTRSFCWHQYFGPCMPPALRLYTCIKSWKKLYWIRLEKDFFETCNKWVKWWGASVDIKLLYPGGCLSLPLPQGYIHVLNHEKDCIKSDFKENFLKLVTNDRSDKMFLLTSRFCPKGLSDLPRGYIHVLSIKSWKKKCIKSDFKEIILKLVANDRSDKRFLLT